MVGDALFDCVDAIRADWGPLSSRLVDACRRRLEVLAAAPASESWLSELHRAGPASRELHRDAEHGFMLLAHTETEGLYRPPHDHGRGWVIYAVQSGEVEMGSYARVQDEDGRVRLVKRDASVVRAGQARVYLPGDIHDTRCLTRTALLLRFTDRDLKREDGEERRMTRYVEHDGVWTAAV
ncbi:MAG: hypothetical protein ACK4YQ_00415 [Phenylobacterium sp.]|uniref:hypothetical protein n=1 Tax=Phenylobacterium sp. TaxID=1871053 RepID=UPI00391BEDB4